MANINSFIRSWLIDTSYLEFCYLSEFLDIRSGNPTIIEEDRKN